MTPKVSFHIYMTKELRDELRLVAHGLGYTMSNYVAILVQRELESKKKQESESGEGE
jgi:hypothetical protein